MPQPLRVVIVGAGFAGLNAAKALRDRPSVEVTVLDRENHHLFQPLLYQVAMAALSPADIAAPIRSILSRSRNVRVLQATARAVDLDRRRVIADSGSGAVSHFEYDYLLLACGARHAYFGHEEWEACAPGLKTLPQATEIRRRVLQAFEAAEREADPQVQREWLTFAIVGGGPTGVELAGAIGELSRYTLARDFRNIDPRKARVVLVEAGPRILSAFTPAMSARAARDLDSLGVQVLTSSTVTRIDAGGLCLGEQRLQSRTVLWAAGVRATELELPASVRRDAAGRVIVGHYLSLAQDSHVFVAGDLAHAEEERTGRVLPGVSQVAIQGGVHFARAVLGDLAGRPRTAFRYRDKGQMATIGRSRAVCEIGPLRFGGLFAWWLWLLVHIYALIGFRNRLSVFLQWAWSYFTYGRGARLIVSPQWREYLLPGEAEKPSGDKAQWR
jgi:NADH:ubiquinone reductase (H+-translocating)